MLPMKKAAGNQPAASQGRLGSSDELDIPTNNP